MRRVLIYPQPGRSSISQGQVAPGEDSAASCGSTATAVRNRYGCRPGVYAFPRLSPDGTRLAVSVLDTPGRQALWVYDIASGRGLKLTQEGDAYPPLWTPNVERLVFGLRVGGARFPGNVYWVPADGSGEMEPLTTFDAGEVVAIAPTGITPDGRALIVTYIPDTVGPDSVAVSEVWELPLDGEHTLTPLLQRGFQLSDGDVSPDGNWLSYHSNETGQRDVYLQPYPELGPIVPVSIGGGSSVMWSLDGSELFYRRGTAVMAVAVDTEGGAALVGTPQELFDGNDVVARSGYPADYHVAPDGRFLMMKAGDAATSDGAIPGQVVLVQNWFQELKERVPVP